MYQHKTQQYKLHHQTKVYSQHRDLSVFNKLRNGAIASRGGGRGKACFGGALRGAEQIEQHPGPHQQGVPREGGRPHGLSQATRTPGGAQHCVHRSPGMSPPIQFNTSSVWHLLSSQTLFSPFPSLTLCICFSGSSAISSEPNGGDHT